jgi:hypothetical protein
MICNHDAKSDLGHFYIGNNGSVSMLISSCYIQITLNVLAGWFQRDHLQNVLNASNLSRLIAINTPGG